MQLPHTLDPIDVRGRASGGLMPEPAGPAEGVSDRTVRVVSTAQNPLVGSDEPIDELPGTLGIRGEQPRLEIVQPRVEIAREIVALVVGDE